MNAMAPRPIPVPDLWRSLNHWSRADQIRDEFEAYIAKNPGVWIMFKRYAADVKESGVQRYSARTIIERIRWHHEIEHRRADWKLNNNFTPYFARKLIREDPSYAKVFELRELISSRKTGLQPSPPPPPKRRL